MLVDAENAESRSQELNRLVNIRCVKRGDSMNAIELLRELAWDDCLRNAELIFDVLDWLDLDNADAPRRWDDEPLDWEDETRSRHGIRGSHARTTAAGDLSTAPVRPPRCADQE